MKVLISTPIHSSKDYGMERWLENVSKLEYPADLLMVDNSIGLDYTEKIKEYCTKYRIKNYKIEHLDLPPEQDKFERIARSREVIRQEVLNRGYDAWFSWENDQLIPNHTLDELVKIMKSADFSIVELNSWDRVIPNLPNYDWGVALISREALEKYSFLLEFGTDPDMPQTWEPGEAWFRQRVIRGGGRVLQANNVVGPIYHLEK